jgi:hypothetical protein
MRSNVSVGIIVIATALLLAAAPVAHAGIEVTGVLSTGSHTVSIDSVQFIGDSSYLFPATGWEGDTMAVDTFLFPSMFSPPQMVMLMGTLNGSPLLFPLAAPQSDSWYVIYSMPQEAKVKFVWLLGGVGGRGRPGARRAGLTVSPSIVGAGATVRAERMAGTSCVFEFLDAAGNRVRTLRTPVSSSGAASATWDGTDDRGRGLPEGVYYCFIADAAGPSVRKLVLTR